MGAPIGSKNALKHGKDSRSGLAIGSLPPGCLSITRAARKLRQCLEAEVLAARGCITPADHRVIDSAIKQEIVSRLAQRYVRLNADKLEPSEYLAFIRTIADASSKRDAALRPLKLEQVKDVFDIYRQPMQLQQPSEIEGASD